MSEEVASPQETAVPAPEAVIAGPVRNSPENIRDILLDAAGMSPHRLPMLSAIFERMAEECSVNIRRFASAEAKFSLGKIENARMTEAIAGYDVNAIAGIFTVQGWDSEIIIGLDRSAVFTLMEAMFGSDGSEPPVHDGGVFSNIEMRVAQTLFGEFAKALQTAFGAVIDIRVSWDRSETEMEYAAVTRPASLVIAAKLKLEALKRAGELFVVIPQAVLMPLRQRLSEKPEQEETAPHDPKWSTLIRNEVTRTAVDIHAILEERHLPLGEVATLKVGQIIELEATANSRVKIASEDQSLYWGHLGQAGGTYTLRIDDVIDQRQELALNVLPR